MNHAIALPIAALALVVTWSAMAQSSGRHGEHHGHSAPPGAVESQPYAGLESRRIKALSEAETASLLQGHGMSLALAAELNGYPGPMHVLELGDALGLTPAQRAMAEGLHERMARAALSLGTRIVAMEAELDLLFATGAAEAGSLAALTASIGALNGRLREVHLAAHLAMHDALRPEQRVSYARLRGYAGAR